MPHSSRRPRASSDRYGRGGERTTRRRAPGAAKHPGHLGRGALNRIPSWTSPWTPPPRRRSRPRPPSPSSACTPGWSARSAARDIREPFAIQARALPDALAGRDVLGRAQTGSGKTLAFGLPLLTRLAASTRRRQQKAPRGLVLVPTRELAQQVADVLTPLGQASA